MANLCGCGCGEYAGEGKTYVYGHWSRTVAAKEMYKARRKPTTLPNPGGLCLCGCGEKTPLARYNRVHRNEVRGEHLRYIPGHHMHRRAERAGKRWKGGRFVHAGGYVYVHAPDHPNCNAHGYVYEHRLVMEAKIGRLLDPAERVHHINADKTDNRPENLELYASQGEHSRLHESQRRRAKAWEAGVVAILLDDCLLKIAQDYARQYNRLPDIEALLSQVPD